MILPNNPSIDVEALMRRVRTEATRLRDGGELEHARHGRRNAPSDRLNEIIDRQNAIVAALATAELRNRPRTQVPARFARFHALGKVPFRFILRAVNYLNKPQREVADAQNTALREISGLLAAAAQDLHSLNARVAALSKQLNSLESNIDRT